MTNEELKEMFESMPADYLALAFIGKGTEFPYLPDIVSTSEVEYLHDCYYYKINLRYPDWIYCKGLSFYYSKPKNTLIIHWLLPYTDREIDYPMYEIAMDKIKDYFRILGFKVLDNCAVDWI